MRPPTSSLRHVTPGPRAQAARPAETLEPLKKQQLDLRNALSDLRSSDEQKLVSEGIDDLAKIIVAAGTAMPEGGEDGQALIRVVGARKDATVPLPGLTVRLARAGDAKTSDKTPPQESTTDATGLVVFRIPQGGGSFEARVLGPDCSTIACKPVPTAKAGAARLRIEVGATEALSAAFALGERATKAARDAAAQLEAVKKKAIQQLAAKEKELTAALARVERQLEESSTARRG